MKLIFINKITLTIALIFGALVGYSQKVELKKYDTFLSSFSFAEGNNGIYGGSMKFSSNYPVKALYDARPYILKFDKQKNIVKELNIEVPGYTSFLSDRGLYSSWPHLHWNNSAQQLDVIITLIKNLQHLNDTAELNTLHIVYDDDLNYITHKVIDTVTTRYIVVGEFYQDSLFFGTYNSMVMSNKFMGKANLTTGENIYLKDLYTFPVHYVITGITPINKNLAYATFGGSLYKVNFSTSSVIEINDNYGGWPNINTPKWPHKILADTSIAIIGTNQDSVLLGESSVNNISFNIYDKNGEKTQHKRIPVPRKFHELGTYDNVVFTDDACYIFSCSYDSLNASSFGYINFFTTPVFLEILKTDLQGNLLWRRDLPTKTGSGIFVSLSQINSSELVAAYEEWNYIEHPNEFVKDLVFVFMNTDGEVLSTQTIATENIADFLVYPNPVAQGEPLTLQLNENFNGQQQIHITSLNGALVQQQQVVVANGKTQIDVNQLAAGQYLISVNGNQNTTVPLVVK